MMFVGSRSLQDSSLGQRHGDDLWPGYWRQHRRCHWLQGQKYTRTASDIVMTMVDTLDEGQSVNTHSLVTVISRTVVTVAKCRDCVGSYEEH